MGYKSSQRVIYWIDGMCLRSDSGVWGGKWFFLAGHRINSTREKWEELWWFLHTLAPFFLCAPPQYLFLYSNLSPVATIYPSNIQPPPHIESQNWRHRDAVQWSAGFPIFRFAFSHSHETHNIHFAQCLLILFSNSSEFFCFSKFFLLCFLQPLVIFLLTLFWIWMLHQQKFKKMDRFLLWYTLPIKVENQMEV